MCLFLCRYHSFDFSGFVIYLEIRQHVSNLVLLSQDHFGIQGLLWFHVNFRIVLFCEKCQWNLDSNFIESVEYFE